MKDTDKLLAKIDNLMSEDSTILKSYENKIAKVSKEKTKYEEDKRKVESDITNIQEDIDDITKASELTDRFADLDDYEVGLKKLGDSCIYIKKIKKELDRIPAKIEELENKINDLTEKSLGISNSIDDAEDELSNIDVELSDAKRYQENLINLIEIAKSGDINKTREEVQEILRHVGFSDKEALAAAKIVLFPEDDLIPYFSKGKKLQKVEVVEEVKEDKQEKEEIKEEPIEENEPIEEVEEETIEDNEVEEEITLTSVEEDDDEVDFNTIELFEEKVNNDFDISEVLKNNGLTVNKFDKDEISKFKKDDIDTINKNVDFLLNKNIKKEFIYSYPSVLIDTELEEKYDYIINTLEKEEEDIKYNPLILISYTLDDFKKLVEIATNTGIKPQDIPLMAYIKGLQPFLQNYAELVNNGINIDDNELAKLASILTINPINLKMSIDLVKKYGLTLKKNSGKYAIMCLAKNPIDLANEIDMIIDLNEKDILKYYPEVLSNNVIDLVNRLKFIKKAGIPYKAEAHGEVVYQSYVLNQEKLNKIVEKKLDLHEVLDLDETNNEAKKLIGDDTAFDALDNMAQDDVIKYMDMSNYKKMIDVYKSIVEKEDVYEITGISFAKDKVNRDINYLLATNVDAKDRTILLTALFHNARKSTEEMNTVISSIK